jgi:hypothetical protein
MSHPFGDLITRHLHRKRGLSQNKLADGIDQEPAVISAMSHGRRLTGPQVRDRILAIIRWFYDQGVLETMGEANALLKAAGLARLDVNQPKESQILDLLQREASQPSTGQNQNTDSQPPAISWKHQVIRAVPLVAIVIILGIITTWKILQPGLLTWQQVFDRRWMPISAIWENINGPTVRLVENNPKEYFGKVESEVIILNVDAYPNLRINVKAVDPDASYTVQILDKRTDTSNDVLEDITYPGEHIINLAQEMEWQGSQSFTINIWISGEGKSATFDLVSIEAK